MYQKCHYVLARDINDLIDSHRVVTIDSHMIISSCLGAHTIEAAQSLVIDSLQDTCLL